ncbi:hypothetical protein CEXT_446741 [Caerostris extrusa]|uniref:Uncharacterized protein n=1 Tax=Caerostris extrusa TaxID=172846 RepID=A0AAV4RED7_CAEEX|nr:hypothetical protein CEXT_446741 [Caerostris extrusa]
MHKTDNRQSDRNLQIQLCVKKEQEEKKWESKMLNTLAWHPKRVSQLHGFQAHSVSNTFDDAARWAKSSLLPTTSEGCRQVRGRDSISKRRVSSLLA